MNKRAKLPPTFQEKILQKDQNLPYAVFIIEGRTSPLHHLFLVMTICVRSMSARLDFRTSSSLLSGRESIAVAASSACFLASSLALCIPRLLPRYSRACDFRKKLTTFVTKSSHTKSTYQNMFCR